MRLISYIGMLGWLLFLFAWIPFFFVVSGYQGGDFGKIVNDLFGGWVVLMIAMFAGSMILIFSSFLILPAIFDAYVSFRGSTSFGQIVSVKETGAEINDKPVVAIDIQVQPVGGAHFRGRATKTIALYEFDKLTPGTGVVVKYLPNRTALNLVEVGIEKEEFARRANTGVSEGGFGKPTFGYFIKSLVKIFVLPVIILGFIAFVFLQASKHTEVYACASEQIKKNSKAKEILGESIEFGFYAFGNYSYGDGRTNVYFLTPVSGTKKSAMLDVDSVHTSSRYDLRMKIWEGDQETEIYNGLFPCETD